MTSEREYESNRSTGGRQRTRPLSDRAVVIPHDAPVFDTWCKGRVFEYMTNAKVLIEFISPTPDPYNPEVLVRNVIYGDYVWDRIVLRWVEKYRVRLPNDFLEHVELRCGQDIADFDQQALLEEAKHPVPIFVRRR